LIVGWCGRFLFFVVPHQFSQDICKWPENQILIPHWTYFHWRHPSERPQNQILIPNWAYFQHHPDFLPMKNLSLNFFPTKIFPVLGTALLIASGQKIKFSSLIGPIFISPP